MNTETNEYYIDHEVRIRIMESLAKDTNNKLDRLEDKIEARFMLLIGLILASIIIPVLLHSLRLV